MIPLSSVRLKNCKKENTESLIVFSAIANKFIKYATKTIKLPSRKILTGHYWIPLHFFKVPYVLRNEDEITWYFNRRSILPDCVTKA